MSDPVQYTVGVSDMKVSNDPHSRIITYALGSCIGVTAYDPVLHLGGLLHFQLPDSKGFEQQARENPFKFADTGLASLFQTLYGAGAQKNRLIIGAFGGGNMMRDEHVFQIGIRNARATKKILWQNALFIKHEDVGGTSNRTVSLDLASGLIRVKKDGTVTEY
ncbi:MAG TPA: chemotaxis protein CheD [bacterium]|nr:chemotaxis protein CheD [bacterium]